MIVNASAAYHYVLEGRGGDVRWQSLLNRHVRGIQECVGQHPFRMTKHQFRSKLDTASLQPGEYRSRNALGQKKQTLFLTLRTEQSSKPEISHPLMRIELVSDSTTTCNAGTSCGRRRTYKASLGVVGIVGMSSWRVNEKLARRYRFCYQHRL